MPRRSVIKIAEVSVAHKKATYTLPHDVLVAIDENWRYHKTLAGSLADSKSEYVADLIRRNNAKKIRQDENKV